MLSVKHHRASDHGLRLSDPAEPKEGLRHPAVRRGVVRESPRFVFGQLECPQRIAREPKTLPRSRAVRTRELGAHPPELAGRNEFLTCVRPAKMDARHPPPRATSVATRHTMTEAPVNTIAAIPVHARSALPKLGARIREVRGGN
jgi:hypothetical protein